MAGERGVDADARRFRVAHFADHDDVGIETQERAQGAREAQPDFAVDLDLVDALDLVFDGILNGDDLAPRIIENAQHRGERGGLAAASGAGHDDHAVRVLDLLAHLGEIRWREAETIDVRSLRVGAQEADGDRLTMDRRHCGDANVMLALGDPQPGAAILRQTLFGDVEVCQDLQSRHGGAAEFAGQSLAFLEQTIDAMPDDDIAAGGLDVEVGGAGRRGFAEEAVDQIDDGGIERQVLQRVIVIGAEAFAGLAGIGATFVKALDGGEDLVVGAKRQ